MSLALASYTASASKQLCVCMQFGRSIYWLMCFSTSFVNVSFTHTYVVLFCHSGVYEVLPVVRKLRSISLPYETSDVKSPSC